MRLGLELLEEADIALPDWAADPTTARALRRAVVLDRRARAAHRLLPTAFRGRGRELRALEHYILTGDAFDDAARPVLETLDPQPSGQHVAAVVVTGIGGTGKSALIEALRRRVERDRKVTFLGFDLDQTALRSGEWLALTTELLRQIGLLHPDLDRPLSEIRRDMRGALGTEMRQRILYTRILNRITDPELRPLASPGLILRHITPRLIEEVLAEPCGLHPPQPPDKADELYTALSQQVWLVRPAPSGGALEHVPDLRRLMLPQILSLPEAAAVAHAAADRYGNEAAGEASADLWEALYYGALLDPDARDDIGQDDLLAMANHLGAAVADLPAKPRAQLREASGAVLRLDEIAALTGAARRRATSKRATEQLSEGLEQSVLDEAASGLDTAWLEQPDGAVGLPSRDAQGGDAVLSDNAAPDGAAPDGSLPATDPARRGKLSLGNNRRVQLDQGQPHGNAEIGSGSAVDSFLLAQFAAAGFDELAAAAPRLARALWHAAADKRPDEKQSFDPSHPAWLACIATLAPGPDGVDPRGPLLDAAQSWARSDDGRNEAAIIRGMLNDGTGQMRTAARLAMMTMALAAGELPILHPALIGAARNGRLDFARPLKGMPGIDDVDLGRLVQGGLKLSDITRPLNTLDQVRLPVDLGDMPPDLLAVVVPGRLGEFHAPLRMALGRIEPGPALPGIVGRITGDLPWWPKDLDPGQFNDPPDSPTLIGTLIDLLDRAGQLPALAAALAQPDASDSRIVRTAGLIDAFSAFLRGKDL